MGLALAVQDYQRRIIGWTRRCFDTAFGDAIQTDERNRRFLEEAFELVQAFGMPRQHVEELLNYVYNRPPGDPAQEVGGVMVTLAQLCEVNAINFGEEAERELARIDTAELIDKIRAKQVSKQLHGIGGTPRKEELNPACAAGNHAYTRPLYRVDGVCVNCGHVDVGRFRG